MIRHLLVYALTLGASVSSWAEVDWRTGLLACAEKFSEGSVERVKCVDEHIRTQQQQENLISEKNQPKPKEAFTITVRDTSSSVDYPGLNLGTKGASASLQRKNGEDATTVKGALFGYFRPLDQMGRFQPFVGVSWNRDGSSPKRSDIRDFTLGSIGSLLETSGTNGRQLALLGTFQLTHREDLYGTGDGNLARAHLDVVYVPWAGGLGLGGFSVVPQLGFLWHRRTHGGEQGNWTSTYWGVAVSKPFEIGQQNLMATLLARRLHDVSVPSGNAERQTNYANLSLDYFFYNPENKNAPVQPSLFISREVGNDFLTGVSSANRTTAGIRFKLN